MRDSEMSRETKLGMVVAGAFVGLLTAVVFFRLQEEDGAKTAEPVGIVSPVPEQPAPIKPRVDVKEPAKIALADHKEPAPPGTPGQKLPQGFADNATKVDGGPANSQLPPFNATSTGQSGGGNDQTPKPTPNGLPSLPVVDN